MTAHSTPIQTMDTLDFSSRAGKAIIVAGSLNMDLVMRTPRVPEGGETLNGHAFSTLPGGKGANQAIACARLGGKVGMIGKVGTDSFGQSLLDGLLADGIDAGGVGQTPAAGTGVAMILVEDIGQNRIVLAAGANGTLLPEDIDHLSGTIQDAAMLVVQLEVPVASVQRAIAIARDAGVPVLLNPAPAMALPDALWAQVDILVPNESEAALLAGFAVQDVPTAYAAARLFRQRGVGRVLITLGEQGVVVVDHTGERHIAAPVVQAVDTTAAGDTFIGGLCAGLMEGMELDQAASLGQRASALCVTRRGAQPSIPHRHELI